MGGRVLICLPHARILAVRREMVNFVREGLMWKKKHFRESKLPRPPSSHPIWRWPSSRPIIKT